MRIVFPTRFAPIGLLLIFVQIQLLAGQTGSPPSLAADTGESGFGVSLTLFSTLAAINAAGYDTGIDSPLNEHYKVRSQIRAELAKLKIPCLSELKGFYKAHKRPTDAADLGQYISFAMIAKGPPSFELPEGETPPDVQALAGFSELLAQFYKEANVESLWNRAQPAYTAAISEYQDQVISTLFETNGYLRNPSGYLGRRFQIYLDLLGAPDQIQVRSYKDDYFLVITPTTAPVIDEIRDAYLAYTLDPLSFKYKTVILTKKALQKYSDAAPALDLAYKDDWSLLVTKCLIKAIDSRLLHGTPEKKQAFVNEAMREGYILTAAFAELLHVYEKQPDAMRLFYPDLIAAVDVKKEDKRLRTVEFAQSLPSRIIAPPAKMQIDPAEESLQTADGLMEQRDFESARKLYKNILEQTDDKAKKGRATYGLAVIDLQEKRWDEALNLFQRTVEANPNPSTTAWSHYYLGQLALKAGDSDKATSEFKQTIATEGGSARAREAAENALRSSSGDIKKMTFTSLRRAFLAATVTCGLMYGQEKAPQPKSQKERDALMKVQTAAQANNADEELKAIDYVLENFDNTDYKVMLLTMGMEAAQAKGDAARSSVYADRLIEADPNNIAARVMQAESTAQSTRENDLDKEQKLKRVEELANKGLDLLKNTSAPPTGMNDAQWAEQKKQLTSDAHDALGQAADLRKNYPEAIKHYQEALQIQPTNSVATARLAKAYVGNKQYDEAIATADKVAAMTDAPAVVKQFAQQQKDAATKLKASGAK